MLKSAEVILILYYEEESTNCSIYFNYNKLRMEYSLTVFGVHFAFIVTKEESSVKKLDGYHSKDELKQNIDN